LAQGDFFSKQCIAKFLNRVKIRQTAEEIRCHFGTTDRAGIICDNKVMSPDIQKNPHGVSGLAQICAQLPASLGGKYAVWPAASEMWRPDSGAARE